jgi:hypothetical protein
MRQISGLRSTQATFVLVRSIGRGCDELVRRVFDVLGCPTAPIGRAERHRALVHLDGAILTGFSCSDHRPPIESGRIA